MVSLEISKVEAKAYASINGSDPIVCSLVKDRKGKYVVNIKKLGFGKSFVSIGDLEDKTIDLDEATLVPGKTAGKTVGVKAPKYIVAAGIEYLGNDGDKENYEYCVNAINEAMKVEYEAKLAEKAAAKVKASKTEKTPLTELDKINRQLAKIMARKAELEAATTCDAVDEE